MQLRLVWSRGESNSRPNKQLKSFLHVYFLIGFSSIGSVRNNHQFLSFFGFRNSLKAQLFLDSNLRFTCIDRLESGLSR